MDSDDGLTIDMNKKQIMLTKILSWYQEDFGKNKEEVNSFCFLIIFSDWTFPIKKVEAWLRIIVWIKNLILNGLLQVLQWILANLPDGERKSQLKELLDGKSYKVGYKHYDWGLNS